MPRSFVPISCVRCDTEFARDKDLVKHLEQNVACLNTMGGSIKNARKQMKNIKQRNKHRANPEPKNKADRMQYMKNREARS